MAVGDIIVGINIGFSKVSGMMCRINNFNQTEIMAKASKNVKVFENPNKINEQNLLVGLLDLVEEMEAKTSYEIHSTYLTIQGKYVSIKQHSETKDTKDKLLGVSSKDIVELLKTMSEGISGRLTKIDILPDMFLLDNGELVKDPIGRFSSEITMYSQIIFADTENINKIAKILKELEIEIDGFVPIALATRNLILEENELNGRVLTIDISEKTTDIGVFLENSFIATKTFNFGGQDIVKDLEIILKISHEEAEKIKRQYGMALKSYIEYDNKILLSTTKDREKKTIRASLVAEIIEARFEDMFNEINKYLIDTKIKQEINTVILTGVGVKYIQKADVVCKVALNLPTKYATGKLLESVSDNYVETFGMIRYISKKSYAKTVGSEVYEKRDKNIVKKILEKIKEFFYS